MDTEDQEPHRRSRNSFHFLKLGFEPKTRQEIYHRSKKAFCYFKTPAQTKRDHRKHATAMKYAGSSLFRLYARKEPIGGEITERGGEDQRSAASIARAEEMESPGVEGSRVRLWSERSTRVRFSSLSRRPPRRMGTSCCRSQAHTVSGSHWISPTSINFIYTNNKKITVYIRKMVDDHKIKLCKE